MHVYIGAGTLPGPVGELHAASVTNSSVVLVWEAPAAEDGPQPSGYQVHFKQVGTNDTDDSAALQVSPVNYIILLNIMCIIPFCKHLKQSLSIFYLFTIIIAT